MCAYMCAYMCALICALTCALICVRLCVCAYVCTHIPAQTRPAPQRLSCNALKKIQHPVTRFVTNKTHFWTEKQNCAIPWETQPASQTLSCKACAPATTQNKKQKLQKHFLGPTHFLQSGCCTRKNTFSPITTQCWPHTKTCSQRHLCTVCTQQTRYTQ